MPLPVIPIVLGLLVAAGGGTGAYLLWRRSARARFAGIPVQATLEAQAIRTIAAKRGLKTITATSFETIRAELAKEPAKPYYISQATGWEPAWLHEAKNATLEWGFCVWDLMDAQTTAQMYDESRFSKAVAGLIGRTVQAVIDFVKKKTIDISFCYRFEIPAVRIELGDGRSFWIPCEPAGGAGDDIQGWNPGTTRPGFAAKLGPWPLSKETPPGEIGAMWIRPLGDLWGWAQWDQPVEVYQIVMPQNGVLKSIPAMSRRDWRIAMMLEGRTPSGGQLYPGGGNHVIEWLKAWRCSGQKYKMRPATRRRVEDLFEK